MSNLTIAKDSQAMISQKLFSHLEAPELIIRDIKELFGMITLHDLKMGQRSNLILAKDSQIMTFYKLFSQSKSLGPMIKEILGLFDTILFSKQGQNYSQASF